MPEVATHAPGKFCWVEIGTTDKEAAKNFYSGLFGWEAKDVPAGEYGTYTMFLHGGRDLLGLYELNDEQKSQGVPPHWLSYVSVEDASKASDLAESMGAEILMGPMDVMEVGRMSVIRDPQGAVFAVWQPKEHIGFGVVDDPGSTCWFELATSDTMAAGDFYSRLFGWAREEQKMGATDYTMFKLGESTPGGMMALTPEMGDAPPNWLVYVTVENCDESTNRAAELGGKVIVPGREVPNVGRFSVIADPVGAVFAIIQLQK